MAEKKETAGKKMNPQEIFDGFKSLRAEQQSIMRKINELEGEKREHELVIETLEKADPDRTAFKLLNGVLVEQKVKDTLPSLKNNAQKLKEIIEHLNQSLIVKGKELNTYRESNNIRIQGEDAKPAVKSDDKSKDSEDKPGGGGILVG